jgi:adenylate kinase family enzyme
MKIVIIGNSGSGKTWLAEKLCNEQNKLIHLDNYFWKPGGFNIKREKTEIKILIKESLLNQEWVAEGVFGELINYYIPKAKQLIWLDMPWSLCHKRLMQRGSESKKFMNRSQSTEGLKQLIEWAQNITHAQI